MTITVACSKWHFCKKMSYIKLNAACLFYICVEKKNWMQAQLSATVHNKTNELTRSVKLNILELKWQIEPFNSQVLKWQLDRQAEGIWFRSASQFIFEALNIGQEVCPLISVHTQGQMVCTYKLWVCIVACSPAISLSVGQMWIPIIRAYQKRKTSNVFFCTFAPFKNQFRLFLLFYIICFAVDTRIHAFSSAIPTLSHGSIISALFSHSHWGEAAGSARSASLMTIAYFLVFYIYFCTVCFP